MNAPLDELTWVLTAIERCAEPMPAGALGPANTQACSMGDPCIRVAHQVQAACTAQGAPVTWAVALAAVRAVRDTPQPLRAQPPLTAKRPWLERHGPRIAWALMVALGGAYLMWPQPLLAIARQAAITTPMWGLSGSLASVKTTPPSVPLSWP